MPLLPSGKAVKDGGWLTYNPGNGHIYAGKGFKTDNFYSYNPVVDTWSEHKQLAPIPAGREGKPPFKGAKGCYGLTSAGGPCIYATKGNNTLGFHRYDIATDSWDKPEQPRDVPLGLLNKKVKAGADIVYAEGRVYLLKGNKCEFYRYNPADDSWYPLAPAPVGTKEKWDGGSWLAYDDVSRRIYAHKSKVHELWYYDLAVESWKPDASESPLAGMPVSGLNGNKKSKDGGAGVWCDGVIFALKGGNTQECFIYFPAGNVWEERDTIPKVGSFAKKKKVKAGADAVYCYGSIYALKGNKCGELWHYHPVDGDYGAGLACSGRPASSSARAGQGSGSFGETPLTDGLEASKPRWNPQGNRVCYSKDDTLTRYEAIYQCYYGLPIPEEKVTDMLENCEEPVYSPNGTYIGFMVDDTVSDFYQICVTTTSGGGGAGCGIDEVPEEPADCTDAAGTADAVAPVRAVSAGPVIAGSIIASRPVWQITFAAEDHCYPEWSPNGQWLCYERDDVNGYTQVWRVPAFGGQEQQLTFGNSDHFLPIYLNSNEIVFILSPNNDYDVVGKVNVSTHQAAVVSNFQTDHDRPSPAWNGNSVVAEALDDAGNTQIVKIPIWVGSESWLTSGTSDIMEPDYSQDNRSVFAVRWTGITSQIVCVDAQNGGYYTVTDSLAIRDNPDGHTSGLTSTAVYEREAWNPLDLLLGGGRRRPGSGIYLSRFRLPKDGQQGTSLGILALDRAEPNPATSRVRIHWQVPAEAEVSLRIYNTAGQLVKVLADGRTKPGAYTSVWNGTDNKGRRLANGVYFYALDNGAKRISRKLVLTE